MLLAIVLLSIIPPPDLTTVCDGYQFSPSCVTGTVVYFVDGFPRILLLNPTSSSQPEIVLPPLPAVVPAPGLSEPELPQLPPVTATPEPHIFGLIVSGVVLLVLIARRRTGAN